MDDSDVPVLIVGAGPTGLALACDLARRGVGCRIVDRAPVFPSGSRGKSVQPRTLEVLDDLGVLDEVRAYGGPVLPYRAYDRDRVLGVWPSARQRAATAQVPYPNVLMVAQERVEDALRKRLARHGVRVRFGTELLTFAADDEGVTATLADRSTVEQVRARYLVAADGGRSVVRKQLEIPFEGVTYDSQHITVADVEADGLDRAHCHVWPRAAEGTIALYPLPAGRSFQLTADGDLGDRADSLRDAFAQRTDSMGIRLREVSWMSTYRVVIRAAQRFRAGRVFLAGDAAHVYPPAGGQGMNAGIQDAYNLGWKLARVLAGAPSSLLDTYEAERVPIAARTLETVSELYHRSLLGDPKGRTDPPDSGQLAVSYRGGPLALDHRGRASGLRAGDRAPDAPCHDRRGKAVRLFDVFRGPQTTVLAFGSRYAQSGTAADELHADSAAVRVVVRPGDSAPGTAIVDTHGHAHRAYDITADTVVAVRPDGHIGMICEHAALADVYRHLEALGCGDAGSGCAEPGPRP
ncbi:FAD-dependent monooxygenase [Streptomyces alboniger]|uniref:3-(3-hydroxyphenyl)propionate hydroxylase n=1 Tax=Streptomyces alboniger TaxID=132473 RepID=A0A5J6HP38_STRAD|nr:FAD-dependent monooxygenase [Streptomyces alboniger]QEV21996.1 3-(3-hydroxyphenyl)propionate hydroxylase [Streptomyces alboniger]